MGINFEILAQILIQLGILAFSIGFIKRVNKMKQKNCPQPKRKEEENICIRRIGDKVYALTFFPISASILLINPFLLFKKYGTAYIVILTFTFMVWALVGFFIEHIQSEELSHWKNLYDKLNAISGGWVCTSAFFLFTKWELVLK